MVAPRLESAIALWMYWNDGCFAFQSGSLVVQLFTRYATLSPDNPS